MESGIKRILPVRLYPTNEIIQLSVTLSENNRVELSGTITDFIKERFNAFLPFEFFIFFKKLLIRQKMTITLDIPYYRDWADIKLLEIDCEFQLSIASESLVNPVIQRVDKIYVHCDNTKYRIAFYNVVKYGALMDSYISEEIVTYQKTESSKRTNENLPQGIDYINTSDSFTFLAIDKATSRIVAYLIIRLLPNHHDTVHFGSKNIIEITGSSTKEEYTGKAISTVLRYYAFSFVLDTKEILNVGHIISDTVSGGSHFILTNKFGFSDLYENYDDTKKAMLSDLITIIGYATQTFVSIENPNFIEKMNLMKEQLSQCNSKFFNASIFFSYEVQKCPVCHRFTSLTNGEIIICGNQCLNRLKQTSS